MQDITLIFTIIAIGYITGSMLEKRHYVSIKKRERETLHLPAVTIKQAGVADRQISNSRLVYGSVVISIDAFKRFIGDLMLLLGGSIPSYESLIDRARREALLRMKETALQADIIINTRIETSSISQSTQRGPISIEAIAYGTAITYKKTT